MKKIILIIFVTLYSTLIFAAGPAPTDNKMKTTASTGVKAATKYDIGAKWVSKAKKFEKKKKPTKAENAYKKAIKSLLEANSQDPGNPDTLNLLGFSHRKIGDYNNAEIYYAMGLEIDPKHRGALEYLGELYVNTNRLSQAKLLLKKLENCRCKEYSRLESYISGKKFKKLY